jgi:hypothetical protein
MSQTRNSAMPLIGIDIGKNSFHVATKAMKVSGSSALLSLRCFW